MYEKGEKVNREFHKSKARLQVSKIYFFARQHLTFGVKEMYKYYMLPTLQKNDITDVALSAMKEFKRNVRW